MDSDGERSSLISVSGNYAMLGIGHKVWGWVGCLALSSGFCWLTSSALNTRVEPVILFYSFGQLIHSPLIQQYVYDRVSEDKGFNNTISSRTECSADTELHDEVESTSSFYMLALIFFSAGPSLITALLIGAWSDKVGRKPAIVIPCIGSAIDMSTTLCCIYFDWPLYVLFIGSFINGCLGYFPAIMLSTMAYIADTTDESMRATKLGILEFFVFIGGTVGQAISGKIIESNGGYKTPYWIVCGCMIAAVLYAIFLVPETLPAERRTKAEFFDRKHIRAVLDVIRTRQKETGDDLRTLIFLSFLLNVSYFGAYAVTILFLLDRPLCWSPLDIGLFCAERLFCLGVGAIIGVKLLAKCLSGRQVIYFGMISYATSMIIFAFAKKTGLVVAVPVVGMFIGAAFAFIRGMMSRQTSKEKQGSLFSAIGFVDTLGMVCGAVLFNLLYPLSLKFDFNGLSFLVAAALALAALYVTTKLNDTTATPVEYVDEEREDPVETSPLLLHDLSQTYST